MTSESDTKQTDLFYDNLIRAYVDAPRFLRRDWLAAEVEEAMACAECRFVLITGEPGAGTTAFMAQLAHDHPDWPRYFIRRDEYTPLGDAGAHSFLLQAGLQLAARFPEAFRAEQLQASIEQRVGAIGGSGEVVGAEIKKLVASPFYKAVVEVQQTAETVEGTLIGVRVGEWVADARLISLSNLQYMALIDPARALQRLHPDLHVVILVDALDDLRYRPGGESLLDWLASCPELPANVDLVLTSRFDDNLLARFRAAQRGRLVEKTIDAADPRVRQDAETYARRLAAEPRVQAALLTAEGAKVFVAAAADKAQGNLGYLSALARAVDVAAEPDLPALLTLDQVPHGLDELHAFFLHRVKDAVARAAVEVAGPTPGETLFAPAWPALYQRILGLLAIAREPLTVDQVRALAGIQADRAYVIDALGNLQQFLTRAGASAHGAVRFYHRTLADLLLAPGTAADPHLMDLAVDAARSHARVVAHYRGGAAGLAAVPWPRADDYGLRYLPFHLSGAALAAGLRELLMDPGWLEAKIGRVGLVAAIADYDLAGAGDDELCLVRDALRLSAHVVAADPRQLHGQLIGRLLGRPEPGLRAMVDRLAAWPGGAWLRPLNPGLLPAGSPALRTHATHNYPVRAVAVTPDGRLAVSASDDSTLRVWEVDTGTELRTLAGHTAPVLAVAITPDGKRVLSGGRDATVRVWDLESGNEVCSLAGHADAVSAVAALDPAGSRIVSGSYDATIRVWDLARRAEQQTLRGHAFGLNGLAVLRGGWQLLSASYDHTVKLWDLEQGQVVKTFHGHTGSVNAVAVAPGERLAVSGSADRRLIVWDLDRACALCTLEGHTDEVAGVAVTDRGQAVSASWDRTLRVWDLESGTQLGVLDGHGFRVTAVAALPGGLRAVSASWDTTLKVWDLSDPGRHHSTAAHAGAVYAAAVTLDGQLALSGADDGLILVWDTRTGTVRHTLRAHYGPLRSLAPLPGSGQVMSWGDDGQLALWDPVAGEKRGSRYVAHEPPPGGTVEAVLPVGIVRGIEGQAPARRLLLSTWEEVLGPAAPVQRLALPSFNMTRLVDLDSNRMWAAHSEQFTALVVAAGGESAVSTSRDRTVSLWDLATGVEQAVLRGHSREVWTVALSAGGRRAVTVSDDSSVAVWDLAARTVLARFTADGALVSCAISPDGTLVVAADEAGRVYLLRVEGVAMDRFWIGLENG